MLQHHANGPGPNLGRKPVRRWLAHSSILSRIRASSKPGALHFAGRSLSRYWLDSLCRASALRLSKNTLGCILVPSNPPLHCFAIPAERTLV
jgi:hypothetical protein